MIKLEAREEGVKEKSSKKKKRRRRRKKEKNGSPEQVNLQEKVFKEA